MLSSKLFKSGMDEIVGIIHPGTKFLPIYGPVKLENKLSICSKIQQGTVIQERDNSYKDSYFERERKNKRVTGSKHIAIPAAKFYQILRPGNSTLWLRALLLWAHTLGLFHRHLHSRQLHRLPRSSSISLWFCDSGGSVGLYFFVPFPPIYATTHMPLASALVSQL